MRLLLPTIFLSIFLSLYNHSFAQPCSSQNPSACPCPTHGATDCLLLPDITAGKGSLNEFRGWSENSQVSPGYMKGHIRLDVATPNIGYGPLEIVPTNNFICGNDTLWNYSSSFVTCPDGSEPKILIKQNVYHRVGSNLTREARDAGWMQYHPYHGHIHIDDWGQYSLRFNNPSVADTLQWPVVSKSVKVSYCLIDLVPCSYFPHNCFDENGNTLYDDDFPAFELGVGYNSCSYYIQGIRAGHVDIYAQGIPQSYVRVPYEACNGEYYIVIQIDPDNHILETNENNNYLAAKANLVNQHAPNSTPYSYIFSQKGNIICQGETLPLEASGASAYLWSTGETSQKITVNTPGRYWVQSTTPCGTTTSDTLNIFNAPISSIPSEIRTDTVCYGGTANLYASGNPHWFDAPVGGNLVFVGNNFTTLPLYSSATYYVSDQPSLLSGKLGPEQFNFSGQGSEIAMREDYLIFNAFIPFKLKTIKVKASLAGTRIFELRDIHDNILSSYTIFLDTGISVVPLNFFVPAGLNFQLGLNASSTTASLFTATTTSTNIGYPFKFYGVANIVGSTLGDNAYPFMFDWDIEGTPQPCSTSGTRTPVIAEVVTRPNVTISGLAPVYLHTSSPVTISGTPTGGTFSGNGVVGNTFYPDRAGIGQHEIRYTYSQGQCGNFASFYVTVQFDSSIIFNGNSITLINNPSQNQQQLLIHSTDNTKMEIMLTNSIGQLIWKDNLTIRNGIQFLPINMHYLPKGVYFIQARWLNGKLKKTLKMLN